MPTSEYYWMFVKIQKNGDRGLEQNSLNRFY